MNTINNYELDRIRELIKKATPGPWTVVAGHKDNIKYIRANYISPKGIHSDFLVKTLADAYPLSEKDISNMDFIAESRTAIPALIDEILRLRKLLDKS